MAVCGRCEQHCCAQASMAHRCDDSEWLLRACDSGRSADKNPNPASSSQSQPLQIGLKSCAFIP